MAVDSVRITSEGYGCRGLGTLRRVGEKDSRRRAASRAKNLDPALAISGKRQASAYILLGQIREGLQDFCVTHSGCHLFQYIVDRDSQPANTGLSAAFSRLQRNNPRIVLSDALSEKARSHIHLTYDHPI
jgi:hypothetical protein